MTTLELLKAYLNAYFTEHRPEAILDLIADDIHCYGFAEDKVIESRAQAEQMLATPAYRQFMVYHAEVLEAQQQSDDTAMLSYSLTHGSVTVSYRLTGVSRQTEQGRKLFLLHFSMVNPRQTLTMYRDIANETRIEATRELLKSAMPGGVMGGYREAGFPFYCVNDNMLAYLGYASQAEFVGDIGGMIDNCIHAEDRERVNREVDEQLACGGRYTTEYRMRKKDHTYIWVHDVGQSFTAEDGREAILSVCYDVTPEKEHARLLESLVSNAAGGIGLYRVETDWRMMPLYATEGVGRLANLDEQEYMELCGEDAMQSIFEEDRGAVMDAIREALEHDTIVSQTYRVPNRDGTYSWINGLFSRFGEDGGRPVMRAVYTPASIQYEVQSQALGQSEIGVCVIDRETNELYYANDASFRLHGAQPHNYVGKTCCDTFFGKKHQCETCWRNGLEGQDGHAYTQCSGRTLAVTAESKEWNGRSVVVVYQQDVTEQRRLQKSVEDSNRELQLLLHNTACGLCVCVLGEQERVKVKYMSDGFCKLYEGSAEELRAAYDQNPEGGLHPDDKPAVMAFVQQCIQDGAAREITYRYTTIKGTQRWITMNAVVLKGENGELTSYATCFDVTEQMQLQHQLADVIHNVPGGVCMYRWDGKRLAPMVVSDQVAGLLGISAAKTRQLLENWYYDLVHPDDRPALESGIAEHLKHPGGPYTQTYRVWNEQRGCYRWVSTSGMYIAQEDGSRIVYAGYADVNDAKELEQRLRQEEEMLQAACDFASIWGWVYEIDKDRIHCFRKLQADYGLPEYLENYPESWFERGFIEPEFVELHRQKVLEIKNGAVSVEFEARVRHSDGSLHWSRIRLNRIEGNTQRAIGTAQLIDDEKYLQARMELEEKQQSEGGASLLAHFVTNITQNKPLVHSYHFSERPELMKWETLESQLQATLPFVVFPEKRKRFAQMHDARYLRRRFEQGHTTESLEYRRQFPDGKIAWVRSVIRMVQEPKTGDILNYEYVYNINRQKISEELMNGVVLFSYELCASLMVDSDQVTILRSSHRQDGELEIMPYVAANTAYAQSCIIEEDRAMYLEACSLENIARRLQTEDYFEIMHRTFENGEIRFKKDQCFGNRTDSATCLLVRSDVTDVVLRERRGQEQIKLALDQRQEALAAQEALMRDRERIYTALFTIVPMVISANLTKNEFAMLNYDNFTTKVAPRKGSYDELIAAGVSTVPDDQKQLFADTFGREHMLKAHEDGARNVTLVHRQLGDDGVMRWIETRVIFVQSDESGDLYTITLAQNVTEREEQRTELEKALKDAEAATVAKSEFLSRMSHEIRTPMNAIMGMTAIAKDSRSDFRQVVECLDKIDMSSHFLLTLINDILEMSRIESGRTDIKRNEFSFDFLIQSVRTVVEPLAQKNSIRYDFLNTAQTDSHYLGDAMRIQQVLVNIITNAIKFTKPGGRVRFSVAIDSQTAERANFRFVVADTGIGMSEEFMQKMFAPFTQEDGSNTSQFGGSGLGLAISKSLTEAMGGTISADSFVGVGSTFTITLPLDRLRGIAANDEPERAEPVDDDVLDGAHVLMAEDHPLNVMVARRLLERKGIKVTVAENGQIAVDRFLESDEGSFDAILMDIRMPVMDGLDATRAIRALHRSDAATVPIIAMTANALDEDRQRSREAGMNAHLAKPFEPAQLYSALAEQIGKTVRR